MAYDCVMDSAALEAGLKNLADGIRAKGGTTEKLTWPAGFRAAVDAIPTGGGLPAAVAPKEVNFVDYDGTVLYAYTLAESAALTQLPPLPERKGLICRGWNWTREEIQAAARPVTVGAVYSTEDGSTRYTIRVADTARMSISFQWQQNGEVRVGWGDGHAEVFAGTGTKTAAHTYEQVGQYVVSFLPTMPEALSMPPQISRREEKTLLQCVELGDSITRLDKRIYENCFALTAISLSPQVTWIGEAMFRNCYTLKAACIPSGVTYLGSDLFFNCASFAVISLPAQTTVLTSGMVGNCASMRSFSALPHLTEIQREAFRECNSLTDIRLPKTVNQIGSNAFNACYALKRCVCESQVPPQLGTNAFNSVPSDFKIRVPAEGWEAYHAAESWAPYQKYMIPYGKAIGDVKISSCLAGQSVSVSVLIVGFDLATAKVSVTSDRPAIASVEQVQHTADHVQFMVAAGTAEGTATITVQVSDGVDTRRKTSTVQVFRTRPAATWSVEPVAEAAYGFAQNAAGYYESQNKGVSDSAAVCRVRFNTYGMYRMVLECIHSSESSFDFGVLSKIGQQLEISSAEDLGGKIFHSFEGESSTTPVTVDYGAVGNGENWIMVKFSKDSGGNHGNDSLQFKVHMEAL